MHNFCTIALYICNLPPVYTEFDWKQTRVMTTKCSRGGPGLIFPQWNRNMFDHRATEPSTRCFGDVVRQSLSNLALMVVNADILSSSSYRQVIYYRWSPELAHFPREFHFFSVFMILAWRREWWVRLNWKIGLGFAACSFGHGESAFDLSVIEALSHSPIRSVDWYVLCGSAGHDIWMNPFPPVGNLPCFHLNCFLTGYYPSMYFGT